jgi:hypothetical protein
MIQSIGNVFGTVLSIVGAIGGILALVLGFVSLFFGRKLFWVFAALIGLTAGIIIAPQVLPAQTGLFHFIIAVVIGILCALLAIFAQKVMLVLAGFLGLGIFGYLIGSLFQTASLHWVLFVVFGILGALLMSRFMEWAVVIISSVVGAIMVSAGLGLLIHLQFFLDLLVFLGLIALGIFFQSRDLIKTKK